MSKLIDIAVKLATAGHSDLAKVIVRSDVVVDRHVAKGIPKLHSALSEVARSLKLDDQEFALEALADALVALAGILQAHPSAAKRSLNAARKVRDLADHEGEILIHNNVRTFLARAQQEVIHLVRITKRGDPFDVFDGLADVVDLMGSILATAPRIHRDLRSLTQDIRFIADHM